MTADKITNDSYDGVAPTPEGGLAKNIFEIVQVYANKNKLQEMTAEHIIGLANVRPGQVKPKNKQQALKCLSNLVYRGFLVRYETADKVSYYVVATRTHYGLRQGFLKEKGTRRKAKKAMKVAKSQPVAKKPARKKAKRKAVVNRRRVSARRFETVLHDGAVLEGKLAAAKKSLEFQRRVTMAGLVVSALALTMAIVYGVLQ